MTRSGLHRVTGRWPRGSVRLRDAVGRAACWTGAWAKCKRGVSAVEFALLAPVLGFSLVATVDLGRGMTERMAMDHALRAGAQRAIEDPGSDKVLAAMRSAAAANFTIDGHPATPQSVPVALAAARFCACPGSVDSAVACSTICSGSRPTFIFYRMSAQMTYEPWLLQPIQLDRAAQVQIR